MSVPVRIVSLVPSISELLWDLGLEHQLVGITKFCIHPDKMFRSIQHIGGTKDLNLEKIVALHPDLILANKEENQKEQIEILQKKFKVLVTDINSYEEALCAIDDIGKYTSRELESAKMTHEIECAFRSLQHQSTTRKRVLYLIWQKPFMVVGENTFIHSMLEKAGFENCCNRSRYPVVTLEEIAEMKPDYLFLSTEPFPFKETHFSQFSFLQPNQIKLVDGEMFSWYGSRLKYAPAYFNQLLSATR